MNKLPHREPEWILEKRLKIQSTSSAKCVVQTTKGTGMQGRGALTWGSRKGELSQALLSHVKLLVWLKGHYSLPTPPQPLVCVSQLYNHLFLGVCLMESFLFSGTNISLPTNIPAINLLLGSGWSLYCHDSVPTLLRYKSRSWCSDKQESP